MTQEIPGISPIFVLSDAVQQLAVLQILSRGPAAYFQRC